MKNFPLTLLNLFNSMNVSKERNIEVGGYSLPADFQCITTAFLSSLQDMAYTDRIKAIYKKILGVELPKNSFSNLEDAEFPASVVSIDQGLAVLELFDGASANYTDYIVNESKQSEIVSLTATFISSYVDLVTGGVINLGDSINLAINGEDGRVLLSAYLSKKVGLPIETILVGVEKPTSDVIKGVCFESPLDGDLTTLISGLYDELDYLLDPLSTYGLVSYDLYYADYDDDRVTLLTCLASPYLYSRQVLKHAFSVNEISIDKAIKTLNMLTGIEVPSGIENKIVQPYFKINSKLSYKDAIEIIKGQK